MGRTQWNPQRGPVSFSCSLCCVVTTLIRNLVGLVLFYFHFFKTGSQPWLPWSSLCGVTGVSLASRFSL